MKYLSLSGLTYVWKLIKAKLLLKADKANTYTKTEVDSRVGGAKNKHVAVTLSTTWSGSSVFTQRLNISGLVLGDMPVIGLDTSGVTTQSQLDSLTAEWSKIAFVKVYHGYLIFTTYQKPSKALPLIIRYGG